MTISTVDFRGMLRVERDGDDLFFTLMPRQTSIIPEVIENITDLLDYELDDTFKNVKVGEVVYYSVKGCIVYYRGTWGYDDDDMYLDELKLKVRNRYIKRWPSRPEPKE